ncbi:MAG: ATP-binding protein [Nitrospirae bacterium]|nr:ATP-binding protein [Nitrospirota bacterium]
MINPSLKIPSNPKYLRLIRAVVSTIGQMSSLSDDSIDQVMLAVDEACTNIIRHAYNNDFNKEIILQFNYSNDFFEVIIEDFGKKAEPDYFNCQPIGEIRTGGYGLHLIRRAFDVLNYDKTMENGNRLKLLRYKKKDENRNG